MAQTDRNRKLIVRTALATSSTIATLVGAQSLVMLDAAQFQQDAALTAAETGAANNEVISAAPGITILRQSGQNTTTQSNSAATTTSIQPPNPVQITGPTIVQQPFSFRTRSSR